MKERFKRYWPILQPWLAVFAVVFGRYLYYGFQYFYQLDDYIQYYNNAQFYDSLWEPVMKMGMLLSRPAAGLSDLYVWSGFYPLMILAVAILSGLYASAALLLKGVFKRHFGTGWVFVVLFALLPLGMEGLYWVSASSRIICGIFFAALGAWLLQRYFDGGRWPCLLGAILVQFLSCCYYEQAMLFSVTLFVLIAILNYRDCKRKSLWGLAAPLNMGLYFMLISLLPQSGVYASRSELMLPTAPDYFKSFLPNVLDQLRSAFSSGGLYTLFKGFWRGLQIMWQDGAILFALLLIGLCILLWYAAMREREESAVRRKDWWALLVGFLLAVAPISVFFVLANPWFSLRGTVCSFAGFALIGDLILRWILRGKNARLAVAASGLALVFCVAVVSELHDYKETYEDDQRVADAIVAAAELSDAEQKIGILGLKPSFLEDQNFYWHEHIHGCTESDWALTGLLRNRCGTLNVPYVTPLQSEHIYAGWNYEANRIDGFAQLYYYHEQENALEPLTAEQTGERTFTLYGEDGKLFGYVYEEAGVGKLKMA